ncbi:hypothetical protein [Actinomadura welshii]|nr:hypothetical protein [Actinomadura madurae]
MVIAVSRSCPVRILRRTYRGSRLFFFRVVTIRSAAFDDGLAAAVSGF